MNQVIRIFISSPSDVAIERQIALQVVRRLSRRFQNAFDLKPVLWEREPLLASGHFQDALDPGTADLMVCILWSRLGSPLPDGFQGSDGRTGLTGTEWEFEKAMEAFQATGKPEILVYRKATPLITSLDNKQQTLQLLEQQERLDAFFQQHFHNDDTAKTFKGAFFGFEEPDTFEEQLEEHLQKWLERRLESLTDQTPEATSQAITWHNGSPFRGLSVFEKEHADIFFGRTKAIGQVLTQFKERAKASTPFLMLLGMSGSGKSSLVNAGVLPLATEPRVIQHEVGHISVLRLQPGLCDKNYSQGALNWLCEQLTSALNNLTSSDETSAALSAEVLLEQIQKSPLSLKQSLSNVNKSAARRQGLHNKVQHRILLFLDQLEELFTHKAFQRQDQEAFCQAIQALVQSGEVWVIGTLRSDFVSDAEGTALVELMRGAGQYTLQPPTPYEIDQIIQQPAMAAGLHYEVNEGGESLASALREATHEQPGALPLLEFCLDELYLHRDADKNQLTFKAYEHIGKLEGAIGQRAEQEVQKLKDKGLKVEQALPRLFHGLIAINPDSEENATARFMPSNQLDSWPEDQVDIGEKLVEALLSARLLISGQHSGQKVLRFAHEALIQHWPRVRQWINRDIEFLKWHAQTEREALRWQQDNRINARLLAKGKPLTDATTWLEDRRSDIHPNLIPYIGASIAHLRKRKQASLAIAATVFISLSALTGLAWWKTEEAKVQRDSALAMQGNFLMSLAREKNDEANYDTALLVALNALPGIRGGDRPAPDSYAPLFESAMDTIKYGEYRSDYAVSSFSFSPDGNMFLTTTFGGNKATLWSIHTGRKVQEFQHQDSLSSAEFSPKGEFILTASHDHTATLWSARDGRKLFTASLGSSSGLIRNEVPGAHFSSDGKLIVTYYDDNTATIWSLKDKSKLYTLVSEEPIHGTEFSPDGNLVLTTSGGTVTVWSSKTGERLFNMSHDGSVFGAFFGPESQTILAYPSEGAAILWSAKTGKKLSTFEHIGIEPPKYSPDGLRVLTRGYGGDTFAVWSTKSGKKQFTIVGSDAPLNADSASFSPNSQSILIRPDPTVAEDHTVTLWSLDGERIFKFEHDDPIQVAMFSPDGSQIITKSGGSVFTWSTFSGKKNQEFSSGKESRVLSVSPDSQWIVTTVDTSLAIWYARKEEGYYFEMHLDTINTFRVSPDGKWSVSASNDHTARVRSMKTGQLKFILEHTSRVEDATPSPDGQLIVTVSGETAYLWSSSTGKVVHALKNERKVQSAAFSFDGKKLLIVSDSATENSFVSLWSTKTGSPLHSWQEKNIVEATISSDSKWVIARSNAGEAHLWSVSTGEKKKRFRQQDGPIKWVLFDPSSQWVLTSSEKHTVLWSAPTGRKLITLNHHESISFVTISPDGKWLSTISGSQIIVWSTESGKKHFSMDRDGIYSVVFSPDSQQILTSSPTTVDQWSLSANRILHSFEMEGYAYPSSLFSPDGTRVIMWSNDQLDYIATLWSAETGEKIRTWRHHRAYISGLNFSADGQNLLINSRDFASVFQTPTAEKLSEIASSRLPIGRLCLTPSERKKFWLPDLSNEEWYNRGCGHFADPPKDTNGHLPAVHAILKGDATFLKKTEFREIFAEQLKLSPLKPWSAFRHSDNPTADLAKAINDLMGTDENYKQVLMQAGN